MISFLLDQEEPDSITLPNGSHLNWLFYASDLVLISHSAKGLWNIAIIGCSPLIRRKQKLYSSKRIVGNQYLTNIIFT